MQECEVYKCSNEVRIAHKLSKDSEIVHCGFMLDIGSRDEEVANQGIAHFWEHMAFKGTYKRTAYHISNCLESLGGELNAFTDKEKIFFHASVRVAYFERAMELLVDIVFRSNFPLQQLERERNVILEEIAMCLDDPEDFLHDQFDATVFAGHPLGMNILGVPETVLSFQPRDIRSFVKAHFDTRNIVFSCVGNVDRDTTFRLAEKHIGSIPYQTSLCRGKRKKVTTYEPREIIIKKQITQATCALGKPAYSRQNPDRVAFSVLVNILGGSSSNSRLNWTLREKNGYVYTIGAHYFPFIDTGLFMISFGAEPTHIERNLRLIRGELRRLREVPLGVRQLMAAHQQVLGQLALLQENKSYVMMMMARHLLEEGKIPSSKQIHEKICEIDAKKLMEVANDTFQEEQFCFLRIEPD